MAKLPTRESLGGLPAIPNTPMASYDTSAIGKGIANIGAGLEKVAAAADHLSTVNDQAEEFETEKRFQEFKWNQIQALDERIRNAEPGQADHFADDWTPGYKEGEKAFLDTVPEKLKPKYGLRLFDTEKGLFREAATFGRTEQKRASVAGLDDFSTKFLPQTGSPELFEKFKTDYAGQIDSNPYLTPIERDQIKREGLRKAERTYLEARAERDPQGALNDLGFGAKAEADDVNLKAADTALKLTPQEKALYRRHLKNLTGPGGVDNPDGSRSTLFQTTVEADGKFYTVPTVWDGKILPPKEAVDRAAKEGFDKFPSYASEKEAEDRYQQLHGYMEKDTQSYLRSRNKPQTPDREKPQAALPFSPRVNQAITDAANKHGVDPGLLATFAKIESGGKPGAQTGSYKGLFQLSNSEFRKHGGEGDVFDPAANADAAAAKLKAESAAFQDKYGRSPTPLDLYMIHQQGEAGYEAHMANPDRPAWQSMASTGEGREKGTRWAKQAIWGNIPDDVKAKFPGGVDSVTSGDFVKIWQEKIDRFGAQTGAGGDQRAGAAPAYTGPYGNLTADDRLTLADKARTKLKQQAAEIKQDVHDFESIAEKGFAPQPGQLDALRARVQAGGDAETRQNFAEAETMMKWQDAARQARPEELDGFIRSETERLHAGGATPFEVKRLGMADKLLTTMRQELKSDPLGWADRVGMVKVEPVDFSTPDAAQASLGLRIKQADAVARHYGLEPKYLREDEKQALTSAIEEGGEKTLTAAGMVAASAGDRAPAIFAEISKNSPTAAIIGGMVTETGMSGAARDAAEGLALRKQHGFESVAPSRKNTRANTMQVLGSSLFGMPKTETAIVDAANAVYEVRARKQQLAEFDAGVWQQGLREVLGERDIGGKIYGGVVENNLSSWRSERKIILPPFVAQDSWREAIDAIQPSDLDAAGLGKAVGSSGNPISITRLKNATLVQTGNGRYALSLGDPDTPGQEQWIMREDAPGQPFELDLYRLRPRLEARRPDLFSGDGTMLNPETRPYPELKN